MITHGSTRRRTFRYLISTMIVLMLGSSAFAQSVRDDKHVLPPRSVERIAQFETPALSAPSRGLSETEGEYHPAPFGADEIEPELGARPPLPADGRIRVPIVRSPDEGTIRIEQDEDTISLYVRDASLQHVLSMVAKASGLNIVVAEQAAERISITLNRVPFEDALDAILTVGGYTWTNRNNILFITKVEAENISADVQGRIMEIFTLDYAAADDVQAAVQGMMSQAGTSSVIRSDPVDQRRTREAVVVEDLPEVIRRIAHYVERIDIPPRQVMIEAHILQVDLNDQLKHGVNWSRLAEIAGGDFSFEIRGFANPNALQGFVAKIDGNDLQAVIEALKTTAETKTLASPKILVVNGQDAHLQVGEQLAYRTTLTTQTSTQETIQFLPVGVVLDVRPQISRDGRVLMYVRPKVSRGRINPDNQLPEERKTEVETNVLLDDGQGLVIGGLIQELTSNDQSKVPIIGDLYKVGLLFQRKVRDITRSEIVITLVPRIVPLHHPYGQPDIPPYYTERHELEHTRANTPLTRGSIYKNPRYYLEDPMPDACENGIVPGIIAHGGHGKHCNCDGHNSFHGGGSPASEFYVADDSFSEPYGHSEPSANEYEYGVGEEYSNQLPLEDPGHGDVLAPIVPFTSRSEQIIERMNYNQEQRRQGPFQAPVRHARTMPDHRRASRRGSPPGQHMQRPTNPSHHQ